MRIHLKLTFYIISKSMCFEIKQYYVSIKTLSIFIRYEKIYALGSANKPIKCDELVSQINGITQFSVTSDVVSTTRSLFR